MTGRVALLPSAAWLQGALPQDQRDRDLGSMLLPNLGFAANGTSLRILKNGCTPTAC